MYTLKSTIKKKLKTTKIKITLTAIIASLTLMFTACGNSANTATTTNTANKPKTAVVVYSNQNAAANNTALATNTTANTASPANTAATTIDDGIIVGEYMVGDVKCTIKPEAGNTKDLYFEVKCADNPKAEIYSRDDEPSTKTAKLVGDKGSFAFKDNPSASGTFN